MQVDRPAVAQPAHVEAGARRHRRRARDEADRVQEVVVVRDLQRLHAKARLAGGGIHLDRTRLDRNRPEQP
jgi:hypothetical protein